MEVRIINRSGNPLPSYRTALSAGMDLHAHLNKPLTIGPLQRAMIPTGLYISLPGGYEAQVRPRSGMAASHGVTVLNTPGTIDADYRGEIKVILVNLSEEEFIVHNGDRIAQMIISQHARAEWIVVETLDYTERGEGGFGSTGGVGNR